MGNLEIWLSVIVEDKEERSHHRDVLHCVLSHCSLWGEWRKITKQEESGSESNLCVVFQGGEDLCEATKLLHCVFVWVELVERLRFVALVLLTINLNVGKENLKCCNEEVRQTSWVLMIGENTEYSAQRKNSSFVLTRPKRPLPVSSHKE